MPRPLKVNFILTKRAHRCQLKTDRSVNFDGEELVATKGDRTRERILLEAAGLMEQKGLGGTSVSEILKRCGVKRGSLYFHFPGKNDLEKAVLERAREVFMGFLGSSLSGATPGKALENFFTAVLEAHRSKGFTGG